jgi:DNA-3-methyladenine glycosylase
MWPIVTGPAPGVPPALVPTPALVATACLPPSRPTRRALAGPGSVPPVPESLSDSVSRNGPYPERFVDHPLSVFARDSGMSMEVTLRSRPRRRFLGSVDYPWLSAPASQISATARSLLGWEVSANGVRVRLTEVEAYAGTGEDPASHAHRGPTPRTRVMFGPAGHAYTYFVFGVHWCLNIVCGAEGEAAAVLLRAGEVVDGVDIARKRRGEAPDRDLARGPARLVVALGITAAANGTSVIDGNGPLLLTSPTRPVARSAISAGPRVGVAAAHDVPWRFWITDDATVSSYRRHVSRRRVARNSEGAG